MMTCARRSSGSERGQALPFVALLIVVLLGMAGVAIDVGYTLSIRQALQASTDAAASAAALELTNGGDASALATQFSMASGGKNARTGITGVTVSTQVKCTNYMSNLMTGANCTSPTTPPNTVTVTQTAPVSTFFARVVGFPTFNVVTKATAAMKGGAMPPLDVMIVLDSSGSMSGSCSAAVPGIANPTRLDCAKAGIRTLLNALWPCSSSQPNCGAATGGHVNNPIDEVGLMILPGVKSTTPMTKETDCSINIATTDMAAYNASPVYLVAPLASDYKPSAFGTLAGATSTIVKAVDWADGNTCGSSAYGIESPMAIGSYFADALTQAQTTLAASRDKAQNVIIFVSDGDGNQGVGGRTNACHKAIAAADAAAAAGTWVFAVAYGAPTSAWRSCVDDYPMISAYNTMRQIASDSTKFFSQPSAGDLTAAFRQIGQSLLTTRILDDNTQ